MKKKLHPAFALMMVALMSGCAGGAATETQKIPSTDKILVVDLHTWMPTGSSSSADLVSIVSTQEIADAFKKETGITIKWFTGKSLSGEKNEASADFIKAIQNGTMPAIGFSWSAFTDRGYYLDLSEALDTPNEFLTPEEQALYPTWKDQFPSYVWNLKDCQDLNGKPIALPLILNPGPATGWYYNKTQFESLGYSVPTSWFEFRNLAMEINSNPDAGPYVYKQTLELQNWPFQFSIGPSFAQLLFDVVDMNHDGIISNRENMEALAKGVYSPLKEENPENYQIAQAAYVTIKDFYKNMLPYNWKTANRDSAWSEGKALLRENGLWSLRAEKGNDNTRDWKFGVFPMPLVSSDSKEYLIGKSLPAAAAKLAKTESVQLDSSETYTTLTRAERFIELYQPAPSLYLNLMHHGIYSNDKVKENAIKFLKFLSTPEHVSQMCVEHQGVLGGVKGAVPGRSLDEWLMSSFPKSKAINWPTSATLADDVTINQYFSKWVSDAISDAEFFQNVASIQKESATNNLQGA